MDSLGNDDFMGLFLVVIVAICSGIIMVSIIAEMILMLITTSWRESSFMKDIGLFFFLGLLGFIAGYFLKEECEDYKYIKTEEGAIQLVNDGYNIGQPQLYIPLILIGLCMIIKIYNHKK